MGISTFSVLSFLYSLANAILSGVAQGLQPLWGNSYGRQDTAGLRFCLRRGLAIDLVLAVWICGMLCLFDRPIIQIFNQDPDLVASASAALPLFSLSFVPMALNLIYTAFLFSTKRTAQADCIAMSRGVVVKALAIFALPVLLGSGAVWAAPLAAEVLTLVLAVGLERRTRLVYLDSLRASKGQQNGRRGGGCLRHPQHLQPPADPAEPQGPLPSLRRQRQVPPVRLQPAPPPQQRRGPGDAGLGTAQPPNHVPLKDRTLSSLGEAADGLEDTFPGRRWAPPAPASPDAPGHEGPASRPPPGDLAEHLPQQGRDLPP